ncbi:MAG: hypothetical protein LBR50_07000 [Tannerella sp.]|jgi:hypothetical protein|nr:hypothetical protein [Tannerella sp.]
MIQRLIYRNFFYLFVFTLFFGVLLYDMAGLKGMDVASDVVLLVAYGCYLCSGSKINRGVVATLLIFLFYLIYSFVAAYNNTGGAIALDFLMQARPYMTFFIVSQMAFSFTPSQKRLLKKLCFSMWVFFVPLGIYGLFSPNAFVGVVHSPANYVSCVAFLALLYLYCGSFSTKERMTFLVMLSSGLIVIRTGLLGFFILACVILIYFRHIDTLRSRYSSVMALMTFVLAIFIIPHSQIMSYTATDAIAGSDFGFDARSTLYRTAGDILKDFFPLGSGYASFATHASKVHFSQLYADYGLSYVDGRTPQEWFPVSDSYYPSLAQFGFVGIAIYAVFWLYIIFAAYRKFRKDSDLQSFVVALILIAFVCIENVFDSFLTSNRGDFMMMFLGVLFSRRNGAVSVADQVEEKFTPLETKRLVDEEMTIARIEHLDEPPAVEPVSDEMVSYDGDDDLEEYYEDEPAEDVENEEDIEILNNATESAEPEINEADDESFDDENIVFEDEDYWSDDSMPERLVSSTQTIDNPAQPVALQNEKIMDKDFEKALEKIRSLAEEKRKAAQNDEPQEEPDDEPEDKDDLGRYDFMI